MAFPKRKNLQELDRDRKQLVVIGSKNPVKILCVEEAFHTTFGDHYLVEGLNVDSGVDKQPFGDEETYRGAHTRAMNCKNAFPEADFWVGIEGGVDGMGEEMMAYAWVIILNRSGKVGRARSATFFLPMVVADLVKEGVELGDANDRVFQSLNSKQQGGAVGALTKGVLNRKELYKQPILLGLIPFIHDGWY